jgi:hypothetical protein
MNHTIEPVGTEDVKAWIDGRGDLGDTAKVQNDLDTIPQELRRTVALLVAKHIIQRRLPDYDDAEKWAELMERSGIE